ncbi:MAG: 50S ribosomal protein L5 [Candidatus Nealsonbacteria bacterium CG08_land_8_20_14_0_20_38_20]|uniref:Large ribosomal subunit protein uL5 n=1 Tax=Candidatus Nealsonbacteria bacterium CG08_land_8_20_14_0_20_38_20 TaxID=1974705 RepID=A0A2H0YND7_9BACT|nr:MAG: 50S ribosomal protein L5 [Candidatus Nealsonbacteria bacterium CG08_land_8_20_14_0_20_38_20]
MLKLRDKYQKEVIPAMMKKFGYTNTMAVPKIEKVVINTGFGRLVAGKTSEEQKKIQKAILNDLSLLAGQKPILTKAKKAISGFKTRQGMPIGAKVILRKKRMEDFLERLINITLPRSRDFRGLQAKAIDKQGNLNIGIKEHIDFPEILPESSKNIFGLELTVVINAKSREEGLELLKLLGFPIK